MELLVVGAVMFGVAACILKEKKDERVAIINSILELNLNLKLNDNETIHPFMKSSNGDSFHIELPRGFEFAQLQKLQGKIENALKQRVVITDKDFNYMIEVKEEEEPLPQNIPFQLVDTDSKNGVKIAIGQGKSGLIYLEFDKVPHLITGGATGWGKSIFTKNLIIQLVHNYPNVELELFDFKAGIELTDFKNLKQTKSFTIKPDHAQSELERIYEEIEERFDLITEKNCRDIFEFNSKSNSKMQYKFVIIEEFTILLDIQKDVSTILTKSLAIARAVGVYFIFTSQRFSADIIDSKIKANISNRVCFSVADAMNSKIILDTQGAEKLRDKGRALISKESELHEFQSFNVTRQDVQEFLKQQRLKNRTFNELPKVGKIGVKKEQEGNGWVLPQEI